MIKFLKGMFYSEPRYAPDPLLYASKGEIVSCENGHEICDVSRDVYVGDLIIVNQFENWRNQTAPMPNDVIKPCHTCGARFIDSKIPYGGTWLHINGQWRRPTVE